MTMYTTMVSQESHHNHEPNEVEFVRRLGTSPTHRNCVCPRSWSSIVTIVEPGLPSQNALFAFEVDPSTIAAPEEHDHITEQVQRFDGSGGVAPYEDFAIIKERATLALSIAAVCLEVGVQVLPNGNSQEPLPGMANVTPHTQPPTRWPDTIYQALFD